MAGSTRVSLWVNDPLWLNDDAQGGVWATVMISRSELHGAVQAYLQSLRTGTLAAGRAPGSDQVSIAAGQGDIARWRSALHALPDVDAGKVQNLSRQVQAGTYHPSADAVAGQIVARWLGDRVSG